MAKSRMSPRIPPRSSAIFFLEKADTNEILPAGSRQEALKRIWACLIKGYTAAGWWDKILPLVEGLTREVPCYILRFDKSGGVVKLLEGLRPGRKGPESPEKAARTGMKKRH